MIFFSNETSNVTYFQHFCLSLSGPAMSSTHDFRGPSMSGPAFSGDPIGSRLLLITNRKSHTCFCFTKFIDFGWLWTAITHCVSQCVSFSETTTKIWKNIDELVLPGQKCSPWILVSGSLRIIWIFAGFLERGIKRQWVVEKGRFSVFLVAVSPESLEIRQKLLYSN